MLQVWPAATVLCGCGLVLLPPACPLDLQHKPAYALHGGPAHANPHKQPTRVPLPTCPSVPPGLTRPSAPRRRSWQATTACRRCLERTCLRCWARRAPTGAGSSSAPPRAAAGAAPPPAPGTTWPHERLGAGAWRRCCWAGCGCGVPWRAGPVSLPAALVPSTSFPPSSIPSMFLTHACPPFRPPSACFPPAAGTRTPTPPQPGMAWCAAARSGCSTRHTSRRRVRAAAGTVGGGKCQTGGKCAYRAAAEHPTHLCFVMPFHLPTLPPRTSTHPPHPALPAQACGPARTALTWRPPSLSWSGSCRSTSTKKAWAARPPSARCARERCCLCRCAEVAGACDVVLSWRPLPWHPAQRPSLFPALPAPAMAAECSCWALGLAPAPPPRLPSSLPLLTFLLLVPRSAAGGTWR